ncbi:AAA family ATPase [Corynebacterium sp.]|uniref:AAA family ATPase n=1 Tax=Corynebacterium sp. TaxID=1720 RepID=UPI0037C08508
MSDLNVIVEGVAGTGKSHLLDQLRDEFVPDRTELVVFHPSTSYEEFVSGLRPSLMAVSTVRPGCSSIGAERRHLTRRTCTCCSSTRSTGRTPRGYSEI